MSRRMRQSLALLEWLLLLAFSGLLAVHTLPHAWRTLDTDFPNYYLAAQLSHEGYDMSQAYDWRWLQREKDHHEIDQRLVGLAPITPFSTLFVWPLTRFQPLQAKRLWLVLQLGLLVPIALILRSLANQPLRRIAMLTAACMPLHSNLRYGQFYVLLLAMLVTACWAYRRGLSSLAGALVAIAAMTKIFPVIFLLYFLRKRVWRALAAAAVTSVAATLLSVYVFGWSMHRHYVEVVLPWTLRGEALPSYTLASSSITALLHRLFIFEPQWNPHPWHNVPALSAVLAPLLQMAVLAPAILLIRHGCETDFDDRRSAPLEWSALLCATLTISTSPASYNFILLLLPVVVLCGCLLPLKPGFAALGVLLYFAIGYPEWNTSPVDGLYALAHAPRLYLLVALSSLCCCALIKFSLRSRLLRRRDTIWAGGLALFAAAGVVVGLRHQHGLYADYEFRLPMPRDAYLAASPAFHSGSIEAIAMLPQGYRVIPITSSTSLNSSGRDREPDQLSFTPGESGDWIEDSTSGSRLVAPQDPSASAIENGRAPALSVDGRTLAFVRDWLGRGRLFARSIQGSQGDVISVTPEGMNVREAAPAAGGWLFVSATMAGGPSRMFLIKPGVVAIPLALGEARYPAASPDQRWLAYSRFQSGAWNLWLLDRMTDQTRRLTAAPCNQVEPFWLPDSKTLLYASDCGRALGFTVICRRRIIP